MGGLWKLAAMSAVIGAGLVVVYQAQRGLVTAGPVVNAPSEGDSGVGPVALSPDDAFLPPADEKTPAGEMAVAAKDGTSVNASVPAESLPADSSAEKVPDPLETSATDVKPTQPEIRMAELPPESRYSRGIDFRRSDEILGSGATAGTINDSTPNKLAAAPAGLITEPTPLSLDAPPLLPVPAERAEATRSRRTGTIELTAGQEPAGKAPAPLEPDSDPFLEAAPPELPKNTGSPARPALLNTSGEKTAPADFDPFSNEPEPQPGRTEPARNADPLEMDAEPAATTRSPQSTKGNLQPEELDEFDPFQPEPKADPPAGKGEPVPLPDDDLSLGGNDATMQLSEPAELDPFDSAAPPDMPATPQRTPQALPTDLELDPLDRDPSPARSAVQPEPAPTVPNPSEDLDLFRGDAEPTRSVPRGSIEPRLTIEKTAPITAVLGQPVVYTVIVRNVGTIPAGQLTIEDRIPRGTRLVGTAPQAEMIEKRLVWRKLGTLQPGEERKVSIKVIPEAEGQIGSVAKVSFAMEIATEIAVQAPRLKVTVNSPTEAKVGEAVPLVFSISNPGQGEASNIVVRSIIPEGLEHPAGKDLEYTLGKLAANETREVRLEVMAMKTGRVTHQAVVTAEGVAAVESRATITIVGEQLLLTRSGHDRVYAGRSAEFTNTVTNEGQAAVASVMLTEGVPTGFEFVEATQGGQYSAKDRLVTWNLGTLPPSGSATVSVTLMAKTQGTFDTTVTAKGPSGSAATVKPSVSIEGFPSLTLERVDDGRLVAVGESITTRIQLENRGSGPATHAALTITLPPELSLVSANGPVRYRADGQKVIFEPIAEIAARESIEFELELEAKSAGDTRLDLQISADHLRKPVRREEAVQVLPGTKTR